MSLNRWDPWRDLLSLQEKLGFAMGPAPGHPICRPTTRCWKPVVDILETPESYIIRADLPGVGRDRIDIRMEGAMITIEGERDLDPEPQIAAFHSIERETGVFSRTFKLPERVDSERAEATYVDGVLHIYVPKARTWPRRTVAVACGE
jgi:HSP20 family protein